MSVLEKIVILHVPNTFNYGSAMMGINFIHYFSSMTDIDVEFICDASTEEDIKRMVEETLNKRVIKKLKMTELSTEGSTKLQKIINLRRSILDQVNDILSLHPICVIVLGGDDLSEYYMGRYIVIELYKLYKLSKKTTVFLVGQSIGPFYSWREKIARFCLKNCQIYSRDPISTKYLRESLKFKKVFESSDLAFLDLPKQNDIKSTDLLDKYDINREEYISIVPSGSVKLYTIDHTSYVKSWIDIVKFLAESPDFRDKKIVLLPHVLAPPPVDDRNIIEEIENRLSDKYNNIIYIKDDLFPSGARTILANGIFTITGRMHAAISTFQMLKPAISLSYGIKYMGVIGGRLGMSDLIIKADNSSLWNTGKIVELVKNKVEYVIQSYDSLNERIALALEENKRLAIAQIEDIAEKIRRVENEAFNRYHQK